MCLTEQLSTHRLSHRVEAASGVPAKPSLPSLSIERIGSSSERRGKGSPVWRGPTPQQGFAAPAQPSLRQVDGSGDGSRIGEEPNQLPGAAKTPGSSAKKPAKRKGGLSMFLTGEDTSPITKFDKM